ncbi:MAG: response regulator [Magnetococcales bacterium]|nr:response regulator [Magnetococcales bacterium]
MKIGLSTKISLSFLLLVIATAGLGFWMHVEGLLARPGVVFGMAVFFLLLAFWLPHRLLHTLRRLIAALDHLVYQDGKKAFRTPSEAIHVVEGASTGSPVHATPARPLKPLLSLPSNRRDETQHLARMLEDLLLQYWRVEQEVESSAQALETRYRMAISALQAQLNEQHATAMALQETLDDQRRCMAPKEALEALEQQLEEEHRQAERLSKLLDQEQDRKAGEAQRADALAERVRQSEAALTELKARRDADLAALGSIEAAKSRSETVLEVMEGRRVDAMLSSGSEYGDGEEEGRSSALDEAAQQEIRHHVARIRELEQSDNHHQQMQRQQDAALAQLRKELAETSSQAERQRRSLHQQFLTQSQQHSRALKQLERSFSLERARLEEDANQLQQEAETQRLAIRKQASGERQAMEERFGHLEEEARGLRDCEVKLERTLTAQRNRANHWKLLFENTFRLMNEGGLVLDEAGRLAHLNPVAERLLERRESELIGRRIDPLMFEPEEEHQGSSSMGVLAHSVAGHDMAPRTEERILHRRDGTPMPVQVVFSPLVGRDGARRGAISIFQDLTSVREAQDRAETASRIKSEFLANMSHEFRTPIHGVVGVTDLLLSAPVEEGRQKDLLETVKGSAGELLATLNDLIDYARIEAGDLGLHESTFDLMPLIEGAVGVWKKEATRKKLQLLVEVGRTKPPRWVVGDPQILRQVLNNLLGNAVKFTKKGEVVVRVDVLEKSRSKASLKISVADTGVGVPKSIRGQLFEPFMQGDGGSRRRFRGVGLGLTIAERMVRLMGGKMGLSSKKRRGSTFWFQLSLKRVPGKSLIEKPLPPPAPGSTPGPRLLVIPPEAAQRDEDHPVSMVLLAEDNAVNQKVAQLQLKRMGHTVHMVSNGLAALEAVQNRRYAMVLMDCQMPIMDGFQATQAIRRMEQEMKRPHMPIIALTANASKEDRQRCEACGMDDFLAKPVVWDLLRQKLTQWMPALEGGRSAGGDSVAAEKSKPGEPGRVRGEACPGGLVRIRRLEEIFGASPEVILELLDAYISMAERSVDHMTGALEGQDEVSLEALCRELYGASVNMEARGMTGHCERLRSHVEEEAWSAAELVIENMSSILQEFRACADAYRERVSDGTE